MITRFAFLFFFQAEDGIRDYKVTGVQTCALPICPAASRADQHGRQRDRVSRVRGARAGHGHPILLRDTTPCLGTRDEREHQRLAPPIPPETPEHGPPHPARPYADRRQTEPPAAEAARLPDPGGMLCPLGLSVALQS